MLENVTYYALAGAYILAGVLAVSAIVAGIEKAFGINPPRD